MRPRCVLTQVLSNSLFCCCLSAHFGLFLAAGSWRTYPSTSVPRKRKLKTHQVLITALKESALGSYWSTPLCQAMCMAQQLGLLHTWACADLLLCHVYHRHLRHPQDQMQYPRLSMQQQQQPPMATLSRVQNPWQHHSSCKTRGHTSKRAAAVTSQIRP
jgi:hypothetical protein